MFTVINGKITFCDCIKNRTGPEFIYMKNRKEIFEIYKEKRKKINLPEICSKCLFNVRNQCEGFPR
jgi:hypothetical protein